MNRQQQDTVRGPLAGGELLFDEPMSRHTTYGIGGPAEVFYRPGDKTELGRMLRLAAVETIPITLLGSGSNCLVSDAGVPGMVVTLAGALKELHLEGGRVVAGSGVMLGHLVKRCLQMGLTGVESLIGVPGTLGGALMMNAGAFGGEISAHLIRVQTLTRSGAARTYRRDELTFAYRSSSFSPDEVIVEAEFQFEPGLADKMARLRKQTSQERKSRQPLKHRSAGSVFKNPAPDRAAGMLIDQAGLKGTRRGDAEISTKHGNFFINHNRATAEEMVYLITLAARTVKQQFGTQLELEIKTLGFEPGTWDHAGFTQ
ncbi:MAG: UDP-N-acetylmuramate dehydrogenase [Candidatus Marinimicrobia bacterium]|nr:UDP-N-acetylmuramate dehydrogenase [Candidatus Neomarinimicrobiota bacterium]